MNEMRAKQDEKLREQERLLDEKIAARRAAEAAAGAGGRAQTA